MSSSRTTNQDSQISSFRDFLKTGELGPLNLRLTTEQVYSILGEPKDTYRPFADTDQDHLLNLQYNNLMITFDDEQLFIYIIQFQNGFKQVRGGLPPQLKVNWFSRVKMMYFEDFLSFIKESKLHYQKLITEDDKDQHFRFPDSGVEVNFNLHIRNGIYQIDCARSEPGKRNFMDISDNL
jgi:hypothetical protein